MESSLRVGLLFGGASEEHEVSVMSARSVWQALQQSGHQVYAIPITRQGIWCYVDHPENVFDSGIPEAPLAEDRLQLIPGQPGCLTTNGAVGPLPMDVIFPLLHGNYGEDGRVQGALDLLGLPYVGSTVSASAISMNKHLMKRLFRSAQLPVLDSLLITRADLLNPDQVLARIEAHTFYPCFVKPCSSGSSLGISKVKESRGLLPAIQEALCFDNDVLVERAIQGVRELECSVLGNSWPQVAGPGEVIPAGEFYDYHSKYFDEGTQLKIPAAVSSDVAYRSQELARKAFEAVGARGLARVDLFYSESSDELWINEINTMPGFTRRSMFPLLWAHEGLTFANLVDQLVHLAAGTPEYDHPHNPRC